MHGGRFIDMQGNDNWQQGYGALAADLASSGMSGGHKRHHGDMQGSLHSADLLDSAIAAAVQSGLGHSASSSPLDWQPSRSAVLGHDPGFAGQAATAGDPHSLKGFSVPGSSDVEYSTHGSRQLPGQYLANHGVPGSAANVQQVQLLYADHRQSSRYAAAGIHSGTFSAQNTADPVSSMAAMAAADMHTHVLPAHRLHRAQQQQPARQQQQQQQLLAQRQHAEAAAAVNAAALHQQQAGLALAAAMNSSQHAAHAGPMTLYGNHSWTAAGHQQQHWQQRAAATAPSSYSSYTHQHAAAALEQQQHRQAALGAARPPRPVAASSYQQQPHGALVAEAGPHGSTVDRKHAARMPQPSHTTGSRSSASTVSAFAAAAAAAPPAGAAPAAAGGSQPVGNWPTHGGPFAVMDAAELAAGFSLESDGNSGYHLECDEDLFSMGTGDGVGCCLQQPKEGGRAAAGHGGAASAQHLQEQRRLYSHHVEMTEVNVELANLIEESGFTKNDSPADDMDEDQGQDVGPAGGPTDQAQLDTTALVAVKAAAVAAQQAAAARQSFVLPVLDRAAASRRGRGAVAGRPVAAVSAPGTESMRTRLLITEVSLYKEIAANSQMALDQANKLMAKMQLPDGVQYMPVLPDSFLFKAGAAWQFPAFVICLGSSYLQRMLARMPQLAEAALACPGFEDYAACLPDHVRPAVAPAPLYGPDAVATLATLRSVQFTCLFLATKVADQVHALGLLRFILTNLSHNGAVVSLQQALNVEAGCLDVLEWRLGPFFLEDKLSGEDEELWAESMGHWDYGTIKDSYPDTF